MFYCNNFLSYFIYFLFKLDLFSLLFIEFCTFCFQFLKLLLDLSISQRFLILSAESFLFLNWLCLFSSFSSSFLLFSNLFLFFFDKILFYFSNLIINDFLSRISNFFSLNFINELIDTSCFSSLFVIFLFERYKFSLFLFKSF